MITRCKVLLKTCL